MHAKAYNATQSLSRPLAHMIWLVMRSLLYTYTGNKFYYGVHILAGYRKQIVKLPQTIHFFLTGSKSTSGSISSSHLLTSRMAAKRQHFHVTTGSKRMAHQSFVQPRHVS